MRNAYRRQRAPHIMVIGVPESAASAVSFFHLLRSESQAFSPLRMQLEVIEFSNTAHLAPRSLRMIACHSDGWCARRAPTTTRPAKGRHPQARDACTAGEAKGACELMNALVSFKVPPSKQFLRISKKNERFIITIMDAAPCVRNRHRPANALSAFRRRAAVRGACYEHAQASDRERAAVVAPADIVERGANAKRTGGGRAANVSRGTPTSSHGAHSRRAHAASPRRFCSAALCSADPQLSRCNRR